jgi:hypothetical protein
MLPIYSELEFFEQVHTQAKTVDFARDSGDVSTVGGTQFPLNQDPFLGDSLLFSKELHRPC